MAFWGIRGKHSKRLLVILLKYPYIFEATYFFIFNFVEVNHVYFSK